MEDLVWCLFTLCAEGSFVTVHLHLGPVLSHFQVRVCKILGRLKGHCCISLLLLITES